MADDDKIVRLRDRRRRRRRHHTSARIESCPDVPNVLPWSHRALPSYENVITAIDTQRAGLASTRGAIIVASRECYEVLRSTGRHLHPEVVHEDETGSSVRYLVHGIELWRDELAPPFAVKLQNSPANGEGKTPAKARYVCVLSTCEPSRHAASRFAKLTH